MARGPVWKQDAALAAGSSTGWAEEPGFQFNGKARPREGGCIITPAILSFSKSFSAWRGGVLALEHASKP